MSSYTASGPAKLNTTRYLEERFLPRNLNTCVPYHFMALCLSGLDAGNAYQSNLGHHGLKSGRFGTKRVSFVTSRNTAVGHLAVRAGNRQPDSAGFTSLGKTNSHTPIVTLIGRVRISILIFSGSGRAQNTQNRMKIGFLGT